MIPRPLSELSFPLWIARNGYWRSQLDRKSRLNELRREARAFLMRQLSANVRPFQREGLNRRQRRAERAGVAVLRRGDVCGIPFAVQPWGTR